MKTSKKKYKAKCKTRIVTFYLHEQDLYEYSKTLNFQAFVKMCLRERQAIENGELIPIEEN